MLISDTTITSLRALHTSAMMDECQLLQYLAGGLDEYNIAEETFTSVATLPCMFKPVKASEAMGEAEVPMMDAMLRFDQDIETLNAIGLDNVSRIRITKLHGEALETPELYEIAGQPKRDYMAVTMPLKKVTEE